MAQIVIHWNQPRSVKQSGGAQVAWPFISSYSWQCVFIQDRPIWSGCLTASVRHLQYTHRKAKGQGLLCNFCWLTGPQMTWIFTAPPGSSNSSSSSNVILFPIPLYAPPSAWISSSYSQFCSNMIYPSLKVVALWKIMQHMSQGLWNWEHSKFRRFICETHQKKSQT